MSKLDREYEMLKARVDAAHQALDFNAHSPCEYIHASIVQLESFYNFLRDIGDFRDTNDQPKDGALAEYLAHEPRVRELFDQIHAAAFEIQELMQKANALEPTKITSNRPGVMEYLPEK